MDLPKEAAGRLAGLGSSPRRRRYAALSIAASVAAVSVAGCGSSDPRYLNVTRLERSIAQSVLVEHHVYSRVACPSRVPQAKGHSFVCHAMLNAGSYRIPVTQTDAGGHVRWASTAPIATLRMSRIVSAIKRSVLRQRGVSSIVTCPTEVLQHKGLRFRCTALVKVGAHKLKAGRYRFVVTEVDRAGHVSYAAG